MAIRILLTAWLLTSMTATAAVHTCGVNPRQALASLAAQRDASSRAAIDCIRPL